MKNHSDNEDDFRSDDRTKHTFGRTELYLLLLLLFGGFAIDSWFSHHRSRHFLIHPQSQEMPQAQSLIKAL